MSPKPPDNTALPEATSDADADPSTPRKTSPARKPNNAAAATPAGRKVSGIKLTPKSAPAGARRRSVSKKQPEPPTLLADFFLGRPSPQRVSADKQRQRRQSLEAVKLEMRQSSVRRLQQPGGVRDRVKHWQKRNAAAMAIGDPAATPSEPTEMFTDEEDSVTEEDRVRIKMRQKKRTTPKVVVHNVAKEDESCAKSGDEKKGTGKGADNAGPDADQSPAKGPPKRVVSDTNWMAKKNRKSPPRAGPPPKTTKTASPGPQPLPKDFLQRPAVNPPISKKIKDWVAKVESPEPPPSSKHSRAKSRDSDSLRVKSVGAMFEELETTSKKSKSSRESVDDGIRVRPMKKHSPEDDGIRVKPVRRSPLPDDGIRVRPSRESPRPKDRVASASKRRPSLEGHDIIVMEESDSDHIEVIEEPDSVLDTPTRRSSRGQPRKVSRRRTPPKSSRVDTVSDDRSWISTDDSALRTGSDLGSSVLTSAPGAKSLADIPFGYSAFSELDLPTGGKGSKRPKAERNPSFKGVPGVFKKVVAEGKKMLSEASETPKPPVVNNPPSIENWLSGTVDPFVEKTDGSEPPVRKREPINKDRAWQNDSRRRSSVDKRRGKSSPPPRTELTELTDFTESTGLTQTTVTTDFTESTESTSNDENRAPTPDVDETVRDSDKTPTQTGLKRRTATRATSSPLKSGGKKPFKEVLKEAFRGESGTHTFLPKRYASYEKRPQSPDYDGYDDDEYSGLDGRRRSSGSSDSWTDDPSSVSDNRTAGMAAPRRKPPTNGVHELSTILGSTDEYTESDLSSHISDTTVTQSTALTKDSDVSRQRSHGSGPGLKRRLTKHSDLVSVLSLPDDKQVPGGLRNLHSRASLRRTKSKSDTVTLDDLLQEFVEDENLYQRELKTLVDGVVPVLLTTVLNGDRQAAIHLFGPESPSTKASSMSKAVVNMGIALEKMKSAHRRASHTDIHKLISWMQTVVPIYDSYLEAWRLGFQDLIVNLLPAADRLDDEDSLIGALPRNAEGDVIDEHGERVDVAHLLKRPILRIKLLSRWAQGVHYLLSSYDTLALSGDFDALQDKARRRQKEETARLADDDAANTDTGRTRDLRTLAPLGNLKIDATKQVNAKDLFSLNLAHSNGQRLECQVELIHRDKPSEPTEKGDLLIRETGSGRRTWLLFPPAPWSAVSARKGDAAFEMVIMIQGRHNSNSWFQLLSLTTDNDEQIEDWLDILGTTPVPPLETAANTTVEDPVALPSPGTRATDVPVGGRLRADSATSSGSPEPESRPTTPSKRPTPSRYHARHSSPVSSPVSPSLERTPTQESHDDSRERNADRSRPLNENMRPEPAQLNKPNATPYRDDGAPPPPIHRTFGSKSSQPPVELQSPRMKRRTSSPLKREYLPSDDSSVTEGTFTSESDTESSEDEFDEGPEVPETEIGVSIKDQDLRPPPVDSLVSESVCSLTPSNSASQAGYQNGEPRLPEGFTKYIASISHWYEKKGIWKDVSAEPCSVVVGPGIVEAYALVASRGDNSQPLLALDLTPLVLLRQSTVVDLEIRSAVQDHCKHKDIKGGNFRFRCPSSTECYDLYMAVHHARLNNQKFIQLENDARFKQFGERQAPAEQDGDSSSRRRSWFGRKNSYRASTRAPSQSQEGGSAAPSSSISASSFLKRLTGGGNLSFNIARSSVDKQSIFGGGSGNNSTYGSSSSSSGGANTPRAPSLYSSARMSNGQPLSSDNIRIRLHLLVTATKWEDYGNCVLQIRRPPPGWHQALRANHGLEKRITVTTMPRKDSEKARIVLDAVLGSGCFTPMGSRGIICGIWEELKGANGEVGIAPATGGAAGSIKKWCFQCSSAGEASWVLRLVHQEVLGLI